MKQFAAYTPSSSSSSSKKARRSAHERRHAHAHGHAHFHAHNKEVRDAQKRAVGDWVTATIDGQVVSWANEWSGVSTAAAASTTAAATTAAAATSSAADLVNVKIAAVQKASSSSSAAASSAAASSKTSSASSSSSTGGWTRNAYYDSESQTADGVVFLNHNGGSGSGTFDYVFGNSLSYASSDGTEGASSPQVLADTQLDSNVEVVIMSDNECGDDDCGYVRPDTVAYHGFDGSVKAFFFEFGMPSDGNTDSATNGDMPAIWLLNAQIPRTLQYGQSDCSCWTSGCGEFDIFEVLAPGDKRCKSTLHGNISGGDSDYFARPTSGTIKAALVMDSNNIHIKVLDDSFDFSSGVSASDIEDICTSTTTQSDSVSIFALS